MIRGVPPTHPDYDEHLSNIFWPSQQSCVSGFPLGFREKEVLISFTDSSCFSVNDVNEPPPWVCDISIGDTMELLDSVTLQGGDVQVFFGFTQEPPVPGAGRISNCLFDMRSGFVAENGLQVNGPNIGILMAKGWLDDALMGGYGSGSGYLDQEVHIANNTFVMAEFVQGQGWMHQAPQGAVAVIDATFPYCNSGEGDNVKAFRGLGHVGLQNNVFRTFTGGAAKNTSRMAMLGIAADDAQVNAGGPLDTNAYAKDRTGSLSGGNDDNSFISIAATGTVNGAMDFGALFGCGFQILVPLWWGNATPLGTPSNPALQLFDGNTSPSLGVQYDPAFVGEYLRTVSPVKSTYRDWRLIPGSPLKDLGRWTASNAFANGVSYPEDPCDALKVALWDGESFGSPRIIDGNPDIGFDEAHLVVVAGSYANHCFSHNRAAYLNPFVEDEQDDRFVLLPVTAVGGSHFLDGRRVAFRSNERIPPNPPDNGPAWTTPPGSLAQPTTQVGSPAGYDLLFTSTGNQLPFLQSFSTTLGTANKITWQNWQGAPGMQTFDFYRVQLPADDEGAGFASWVNIQPFVFQPGGGVPVLWGNMQPEYR